MLKQMLPLIAGLGAALFAAPARADVIYDFVTSSATGTQVMSNGFLNDGTGFTGFPLSLTFTDAGVASGRVSGSISASFNLTPQIIGLTGFVSLSTYMDGVTTASLDNSLSLDATFSAAGAITAETIQFSGSDLTISLVNGAALLGSDGLLNCTAFVDSGACASSGSFVRRAASVPEPESLLLLATGLIGLVGLRRTRP